MHVANVLILSVVEKQIEYLRFAMSSDSELEKELLSVEEQLIQVNRAVQKLLDKQQKLQDRREQIKLQIQQNSSEKLASIDWDKSDYPWSNKLYEIMLQVFKIEKLRPYQLSTMNAIMSKHDCILLMPTGGGKSLCFQLPAMLLDGITLVVSPLVALMEDQFMALEALNVPVQMLSASSSRESVNYVHNAMTDKKASLKLLYVTPEKLAKSKRFLSKLEKMYKMGRFSLLAIDEVHCCSQWGHDFRPDYKFLGIMKRQFPEVPIIGLTATATSSVISDVQNILNLRGCLVLRASFNRPNLKYEVHYKSSSQKENVDELEILLKQRFQKQSGIIYCFSIRESEEIASDLRKRGIRALSYHAQLDSKTRSSVHKKWISSEIQVVVATVAFGMGIDKPDVRYVIHHSLSKSMENFYQESGRAGRDDQEAYCILFYRFADIFRQSCMVFTEQTGLEKLYAMVAYCLDLSRCRRAIIAQHFGERWESSDCKQMCDHCQFNENLSSEKDVTQQCLTLFKILEHCNAIDERLTALKLIDAWVGKGPPKLRPPEHISSSLNRELCEKIIAYLLLEGYLKEEFHFTPYSTISYMNCGPKANAVKNAGHKVLIELPSGKRKSDPSKSKCPNNSMPSKKPKTNTTESSVSINKNAKESKRKAVNCKLSLKKCNSRNETEDCKSSARLLKDKDVIYDEENSLVNEPVVSDSDNIMYKKKVSHKIYSNRSPVIIVSDSDE